MIIILNDIIFDLFNDRWRGKNCGFMEWNPKERKEPPNKKGNTKERKIPL